MPASFLDDARRFQLAFAAHVAEEAPGFTAWARRNASERYSKRDFIANTALGFVGTLVATAALKRSERRALALAYYTLVVTQQAVFNAAFHAGTTLVYREYSPGLVTSLLNIPLWRSMTRAGIRERRLSTHDVVVCTVAAGVVHAIVVARQVYFFGVRER